MAQPAGNIYNFYILRTREMLRLLVRKMPGRQSHCVTMAIACSASVLIGEIWQLPATALIPIFVLALWQNDRVLNMMTGTSFMKVVIILPILLYVGVTLSINNDFMMLFTNITLAFIFFFLGTASQLKSLGTIIGLFLSYLLIGMDTISNSDGITRLILYLTLDFFIVSGILFAGGLLISPSPKTILMKQIGHRLSIASQILRQPDNRTHQDELNDLIDEGSSGMLLKLALSGMEKIWKPEDLNALRQASLHCFAILVTIRTITRPDDPARTVPPDDPQIPLYADLMAEMAQYFHYNAYPEEITVPPAQNPVLNQLADLLARFSTPSEEKLPPPPPKPKGFFVPDAFTDIEYLRFSVKGASCVFICILIYKMLNWPGIHTCIITCFVVALPTIGEVIAKQRLRIGGATIGCTLAGLMIIFLMPHMTDISQLLLALGLVVLVGGWVKCGDPRIAYGGLQAILAFFLSDLTHFTPATDLTVPRDRVIGIMIGLTVTYIVFTHIWPRSGNHNIMGQLGTIQTLLTDEDKAATPLLRIVLAAKTQEAIVQTKQMIENASREPPGHRPTRDQLQYYVTALHQASRLMGDLLLPPPLRPGPLHADPRFGLLSCTQLHNNSIA